jgi:hypothetical protein
MSEHNELTALLQDRSKGVHATKGIGGLMARLWRQILLDTSMELGKLEHLLQRHIERGRRAGTDPSIVNYYNKGNLRRELAKPTMTWRVFIKALRVIDIVHVRFAVELTHRGGKRTLHGIDVNLADDVLIKEEKEEAQRPAGDEE